MLEWELFDGDERGIASYSLPVTTDSAGLLLRGARPDRALRAVVNDAGTPADILSLGFASLYAVSSRFAAATEGLSGLSFGPIHLDGIAGEFLILGVTGTCGSVDYARSEVVARERTAVQLRGLVVTDPNPPTDFAIPSKRDSILLSSRAASQLRAAGLRNVRLARMEDLEYWVPADRLT